MKTFVCNDLEFSKLFSKYSNLEDGPWIAGGSVRKIWEGKPWRGQDVDFFFKNPNQLSRLVEQMTNFGKIESVFKTENALTYKIYQGPEVNPSIWNIDELLQDSDYRKEESNWLNIQLVQKRWHSSAWQLINDFDIGLSQFVTDGSVILATAQAIQDSTDCKIRPNKINPKEITPMRLTKYCAYGFEPELDTLETVLKQTIKSGYNNDDY